jgi:hypothetical protein
MNNFESAEVTVFLQLDMWHFQAREERQKRPMSPQENILAL